MNDVTLLSVQQVADITGLSAYTIRAAVRDLELPATKLRGRIRIHPDDLAAWVEANRVEPGASVLDLNAAPVPSPRQPRPDGGYRAAARARKAA